MKLRIAVAGVLPDNEQIHQTLDMLLHKIQERMVKNVGNCDTQILICPQYAGDGWLDWNRPHGNEIFAFNTADSVDPITERDYDLETDSRIRLITGVEMCKKADISIAVWNEDPAELDGAVWEYIQTARDKGAPCIWISSGSGNVYCVGDSYYRKFDSKYLNETVEPIPDDELIPVMPDSKEGSMIVFWSKCRSRYLKRHNAENNVYPSVDDSIMKDDFEIEDYASGGEKIRTLLLDKYNGYDTAAAAYGKRYQAILYQRSVLPFIATIFLTIGFYVEYIVGLPIILVFPGIRSDMETSMSLIAGIGFLINATMLLYVYRLSVSTKVTALQNGFIRSRCIAEIMRVAVHFLPYGYELDLGELSGSDKRLFTQVRHMCDDCAPRKFYNDRTTSGYVLKHCREMLMDQRVYHERSMKRFELIVRSLEKWERIFLYIGFVSVIAGGMLQFVLLLPPVKAAVGDDLKNIGCSLLNALAMIFPGWSGYFSAKATLNNFRYNYDNHSSMLEKINKILERTDTLIGNNDISTDVARKVFDDVVELMLGDDIAEWSRRYHKTSITPI